MRIFSNDEIEFLKIVLAKLLARKKCSTGDFRASFGVKDHQDFYKIEFVGFCTGEEPHFFTDHTSIQIELRKLLLQENGKLQNTDIFKLNFKVKIADFDLALKSSSNPLQEPDQVFESGKANAVLLEFRNAAYKEFCGSDDPAVYRMKKYGKEFAEKFTLYLMKVEFFGASHRDYCGMGFAYDKQTREFLYGTIWDYCLHETILNFSSAERFVLWLGEQSDISLSRQNDPDPFYRNNQTVTYYSMKSAMDVSSK